LSSPAGQGHGCVTNKNQSKPAHSLALTATEVARFGQFWLISCLRPSRPSPAGQGHACVMNWNQSKAGHSLALRATDVTRYAY